VGHRLRWVQLQTHVRLGGRRLPAGSPLTAWSASYRSSPPTPRTSGFEDREGLSR